MANCQRQLLQGFADCRNGKSMFKTLFVLLCHVPGFFQNALEHACGLMVCHDVVDQIVSSKLTEGTFEFTPVVEELFQMPLRKKKSDIKNKIIQGFTPQVFHQRETRKCYRLLFFCSAILPDVRHVQRSLLIASTEQCSLPLFSFFFYWCLVRDKKIIHHSPQQERFPTGVTNHKTQASIFHNPKGICLFAALPKKKDAWGRQAEDKHEYEEKKID